MNLLLSLIPFPDGSDFFLPYREGQHHHPNHLQHCLWHGAPEALQFKGQLFSGGWGLDIRVQGRRAEAWTPGSKSKSWDVDSGV